jgi:hypothetical protein
MTEFHTSLPQSLRSTPHPTPLRGVVVWNGKSTPSEPDPHRGVEVWKPNADVTITSRRSLTLLPRWHWLRCLQHHSKPAHGWLPTTRSSTATFAPAPSIESRVCIGAPARRARARCERRWWPTGLNSSSNECRGPSQADATDFGKLRKRGFE